MTRSVNDPSDYGDATVFTINPHANIFGDMDRAINPLLRRNATQKGEIGRVRRHWLEEARGHPVMNSADPMRVGRGPPLEFEIETTGTVGKVEKTGPCSGKSRRPCSVVRKGVDCRDITEKG